MPKRRLLGCSFPIAIGLIIVVIVLLIVGFLAGPLGQGIVGNVGLPAWMSVSQPEPKLPAEAVFNILGFPVTNSFIAAWITILFLVAFSFAVTRRMKIIPGRVQMAFEFLLGWLYDFCTGAAGDKDGRRFFPLVATIFLFVGFNAWLGLLPGYGSILAFTHEGETHLIRAANTDINVPLAIAISAIFIVVVFGFKRHGVSYPRKFVITGGLVNGFKQVFRGKIGSGIGAMFVGFIELYVGFLEFISEVLRLVSLTFRLFGNMTAGEILLLVATFLIPWIFALPFYGLELLVGFIQAIIFSGLTLIYLIIAVSSHDEEAH